MPEKSAGGLELGFVDVLTERVVRCSLLQSRCVGEHGAWLWQNRSNLQPVNIWLSLTVVVSYLFVFLLLLLFFFFATCNFDHARCLLFKYLLFFADRVALSDSLRRVVFMGWVQIGDLELRTYWKDG